MKAKSKNYETYPHKNQEKLVSKATFQLDSDS